MNLLCSASFFWYYRPDFNLSPTKCQSMYIHRHTHYIYHEHAHIHTILDKYNDVIKTKNTKTPYLFSDFQSTFTQRFGLFVFASLAVEDRQVVQCGCNLFNTRCPQIVNAFSASTGSSHILYNLHWFSVPLKTQHFSFCYFLALVKFLLSLTTELQLKHGLHMGTKHPSKIMTIVIISRHCKYCYDSKLYPSIC